MQQYNVIGIMSGTSLDGVDLAYCTFQFNTHWTYAILKAETISYSEEWKKILTELPTKNAETFVKVDSALGKLFGQLVKDFAPNILWILILFPHMGILFFISLIPDTRVRLAMVPPSLQFRDFL